MHHRKIIKVALIAVLIVVGFVFFSSFPTDSDWRNFKKMLS